MSISIDIKRMQEALRSKVYTMPKGLSREQKRQFIIESAK